MLLTSAELTIVCLAFKRHLWFFDVGGLIEVVKFCQFFLLVVSDFEEKFCFSSGTESETSFGNVPSLFVGALVERIAYL